MGGEITKQGWKTGAGHNEDDRAWIIKPLLKASGSKTKKSSATNIAKCQSQMPVSEWWM